VCHSEASRFDVWGILKLSLRPASYGWELLSTDDEVVDRGEWPANR
jgi:hypothetical protein